MKEIINLNQGWQFIKDVKGSPTTPTFVNLPHNWNSIDGQDGKNDYFRGLSTYEKTIKDLVLTDDKVLFVEFKGVNSSCNVYFNKKLLGRHDGGYSTFRFKIDNKLVKEINNLFVEVDNSVNDDVYPQRADFTFYGGIYRDVNLIIASKNHFDLEKFGGLGADIDVFVKKGQGVINVKPFVVGKGSVSLLLLDAKGKEVAKSKTTTLTLKNPRLWDGLKDPYLYTLKVQLINQDEVEDEIVKQVGFRSFYVDSKKGFFLNDELTVLRGVCRHQDRKDIGNSITNEHQDEDMALIKEVGANTIRLAHYQHDDYFLDLCDKHGVVVWAEIPYISKHLDNGDANALSQMQELIYQQKHHPSICFWGISNEITMFKGHQKQLVALNKKLHDLCHELDSHRLTTLACFAMCGPNNAVTKVTDVVSWNFYFGWYTPFLWLNRVWFDLYHFFNGKRAVGLSEYGAEGMPNLHSNYPHRGDSTEEYQLIYHEYMLRFLYKRPWIWGSHVWNMFDFGSDGRNHGGDPGVNHKGLMTFDHKTKKDSFYIYQAYWNQKPLTWIAGKRFKNRNGNKTLVRIITNEDEVSLFVNDKLFKVLKGKKYYKVRVPLKSDIILVAKGAKSTDKFTFKKVAKFDRNYKLQVESNNYSWEK